MRTVRVNRLVKHLKINRKDIKQDEKGTTQSHNEKNGISCVSWIDSGLVILISKVHRPQSYTDMKRWNSDIKNFVNI